MLTENGLPKAKPFPGDQGTAFHLNALTFFVLGYLTVTRLVWDPETAGTTESEPVGCFPSPGPSVLLTSAAVTVLTLLPSSGAACVNSDCWALACFCLLRRCAELLRYREKRLLGRGLVGFDGAGLETGLSAADS